MDSAKQRGDAGKMLGKGNKEAEAHSTLQSQSEHQKQTSQRLKHEAEEDQLSVLMSFCSQT